jgi:hypothetical protein
MGDMGDIFREWNEAKKEAKSKRLASFNAEYRELFEHLETLEFRQCSPYHFQLKIDGELVNWWPSTGKWSFKNHMYFGTHKDLLGFIKNRTKSLLDKPEIVGKQVTSVIVDEDDPTPPWEDPPDSLVSNNTNDNDDYKEYDT